MQRDAVSVEANLFEKRANMGTKRRVKMKEEPSTYSSDAKIDSLIRTIERMMEVINFIDRIPTRENQLGLQNRNQNVRRNPPQIKQREQRAPYQHIRPPFQENYVYDDGEIVEDVEEN